MGWEERVTRPIGPHPAALWVDPKYHQTTLALCRLPQPHYEGWNPSLSWGPITPVFELALGTRKVYRTPWAQGGHGVVLLRA